MNTNKIQDNAAGCLFGLAIGDALAAPTEFIQNIKEIEARFGKGGPSEPKGNPAHVTDDTQMTIALGEALRIVQAAGQPFTAQTVEEPIRSAFVAWMVSPDNNRAPGMTCLRACSRLQEGFAWTHATIHESKGCGANMRVAPVGLLPVDETTRAGLAQFQAALTHGHPTALAASDLTAWAVADLLQGHRPDDLPARLLDYARSQRDVYHSDWLGDLWKHEGTSPQTFIARGWDECEDVLHRLSAAVVYRNRDSDPCNLTGEGWIAEEAFATGMLCFLLFPDDPVAAIRRAAVTSGDSDSLACLAGAFAGAYHGLAAWPDDWIRRIEYRERLDVLTLLTGFS